MNKQWIHTERGTFVLCNEPVKKLIKEGYSYHSTVSEYVILAKENRAKLIKKEAYRNYTQGR